MPLSLGVTSTRLSTRLNVTESQRLLVTGSSFLGVQAHLIEAGLLRLSVRRWWLPAYQAELSVRLRESDRGTEVDVRAGIRLGVVLFLVVWAIAFLLPTIAVASASAKGFFLVVMFLPLLSAFVGSRFQIRYALGYIRKSLDASPEK